MKKILLLSVNPKGTHQLRLDEEFRRGVPQVRQADFHAQSEPARPERHVAEGRTPTQVGQEST